jgi:transposase
MSTHKSEDYKITAVNYYLKSNKTQEEICKIFNCSARSLMRWVERYNKENNVKRHSKKSISYKITNEHVKFLLSEIKNNKTITMEDLTIKLNEKFKNLNISARHISNVIKDNNISLKLTHIQHIPIKRFSKDININDNLKEFYKEVKKYDLNNIISIDETSINALQIRNHCYNEVGKRCTIKTQSKDVFKKYTAIFAISTSGVIGWDMYEKGGIDSDRLYKFIETNITNKYKNKLIILDNASSHLKKIILFFWMHQ